MTASQNGWRVIDSTECARIDVPGGRLSVHPKLAVIFTDLAHQWHERVEPLQWPGCWGHTVRPIKGSKLYSNHSSGTAIDLCAPQHPQGVPVALTFTDRELAVIAELEARYLGVLTWGGRWTGASVDGMHWEVTQGVSVASVDRLTRRLTGTDPEPPPPAPTPAAKPPAPPAVPVAPGWTGPDLRGTGLALRGEEGANGPRVAALQRFWRDNFPLYAKHLDVDGWWGPQTTGVCREFAHRSGIPSADGANIGPQLARALHRAGALRTLTAGQARALGHITRGARR